MNWEWLLLLGVVSFVTALVVTPLLRELSLRYGLMDRPDDARHSHVKAVPRTGGLPVAISYLAPFALLLALPSSGATAAFKSYPFDWELPVAALVVLGTGLLDDVRGLNPWQKLLGVLIASALACAGGVRIIGIHSYLFSPLIGVPVTLLWLLVCTNGFNLIDGIDGLATGVGILTTLAILLSAIFQHNPAVIIATVPLAASLLGFLRYNFSPASIFLGDGGSLFLGFLLGCYAVLWGQKSTTILGMTAPLIALALPLLDTSVAIGRRFLRGQPIFRGDRGHIHHRLLDRGFTPRRVVLWLYACCGIGGALSFVQSTNEEFAGLILVLFLAGAGIGIHWLDYVEFGAFRRIFADGMLTAALRTNIQLRELNAAFAAAATVDECWQILRRSCVKFGFARAALTLCSKSYLESVADLSQIENSWIIRIPLPQRDYVELVYGGEDNRHTAAVGAFAEVVGTALRAKRALLQSPTGVPRPVRLSVVGQLAKAAGVGDSDAHNWRIGV
jgi:UDP-GlcNAc:undecaprenyl-phosphate GlcNAc-1-phosphate transferase